MGTNAILFNRRRYYSGRKRASLTTAFNQTVSSERQRALRQLAAEIRAQGSAADVAAASLRAYMPKPFPPQRPKHPVKDWA